MKELLMQILMYAPPLVAGLIIFQKLRKKYARPLQKGVDPRVYLITLGVTAAGYLVYAVLFTLIYALLTI